MKRTFGTALIRLSKSKPTELQSTLKFLAQTGKSTTISSLFENGKTEASHVKEIVGILNSDLPDVEHNKKRVDAHYDMLMSRLKQVVEKSISNDKPSPVMETSGGGSQQLSVQERISRCHSGEDLYQLLLELQLAKKLSRGAMVKIVMHRNFTHLRQVCENIAGFSHELELAAMLCYRLHGSESSGIYETYSHRWTSEWHNLARVAQNLVWKCDYRATGVMGVSRRLNEIRDWSSSDTVGLYQALYSAAHQLPRVPQDKLTKVQSLFVEALRALSPGIPVSEQAKKNCLIAVRASLENRLASDCDASTDAGTSVFQYRFMRRLDDVLQHSARDSRLSAETRLAITNVLDSLHREEEHARTQMVLKFI